MLTLNMKLSLLKVNKKCRLVTLSAPYPYPGASVSLVKLSGSLRLWALTLFPQVLLFAAQIASFILIEII